jgi:hypothetical protein
MCVNMCVDTVIANKYVCAVPPPPQMRSGWQLGVSVECCGCCLS